MKLGIVVTTDRHLEHVVGITRAASAKGHQVSLFAMDEGVRLVGELAFIELCTLGNVTMSLCKHSAEEHRVHTKELSKEIVVGSQFQNAMMGNRSDRVIVL